MFEKMPHELVNLIGQKLAETTMSKIYGIIFIVNITTFQNKEKDKLAIINTLYVFRRRKDESCSNNVKNNIVNINEKVFCEY